MQTYIAYLVVGLQVKDIRLSPLYSRRNRATNKEITMHVITLEDWIDYFGDTEYYEFNSGQITKEDRVHGYIAGATNSGANPVDFSTELTYAVLRFKNTFSLEPKIFTVLHLSEE